MCPAGAPGSPSRLSLPANGASEEARPFPCLSSSRGWMAAWVAYGNLCFSLLQRPVLPRGFGTVLGGGTSGIPGPRSHSASSNPPALRGETQCREKAAAVARSEEARRGEVQDVCQPQPGTTLGVTSPGHHRRAYGGPRVSHCPHDLGAAGQELGAFPSRFPLGTAGRDRRHQ